MTDLNIPADLTVTPDLRSTAASFMVLAASSLGPVPTDAEGRRRYGYRLAQEAASLAAAFARPMDGLSHFLAQQRAAGEKAPAKGILRSVELVDLGTPRPGARQAQKVKMTVESTANPTQYTKPGDVQEFLSDFTSAVGFGDFEARARALVGQECLFHKYLEDTEGRSKKGTTATVVVSVRPLNVDNTASHTTSSAPTNGQRGPIARQSEEPRPERPARSPGSVTRPSREDVARAGRAAVVAEGARAAGEPWTDQTFIDVGWRDRKEHDDTRRVINDTLAGASQDVKARIAVLVDEKGFVWREPWVAERATWLLSRIDCLIREEEAALVSVGGGEPAYGPDEEPF